MYNPHSLMCRVMTVQSRKCQLSPALDFDSGGMIQYTVWSTGRSYCTVRREDIQLYITKEKGLCTVCPVYFLFIYF
jgi:hypothetical protein